MEKDIDILGEELLVNLAYLWVEGLANKQISEPLFAYVVPWAFVLGDGALGALASTPFSLFILNV